MLSLALVRCDSRAVLHFRMFASASLAFCTSMSLRWTLHFYISIVSSRGVEMMEHCLLPLFAVFSITSYPVHLTLSYRATSIGLYCRHFDDSMIHASRVRKSEAWGSWILRIGDGGASPKSTMTKMVVRITLRSLLYSDHTIDNYELCDAPHLRKAEHKLRHTTEDRSIQLSCLP